MADAYDRFQRISKDLDDESSKNLQNFTTNVDNENINDEEELNFQFRGENDDDEEEEEEEEEEVSDSSCSTGSEDDDIEDYDNINSIDVYKGDDQNEEVEEFQNELVFSEQLFDDVETTAVVPPQKKQKMDINKKDKKTKAPGKSKKKKKRKDPSLRKNIRNVFAGKEMDTMTQQLREKEQDRLKRLGLLAPPQLTPLSHNVKGNSTSKATASSTVQKTSTIEKEVICLDSSSEDETPAVPVKTHEILVLSSDSEDEEIDQDGELLSNHHSELGLHTNDAFNTPDENGQVLINLQRKENEKCLYLSKRLSSFLKPHQIGGVRFLYDNLIESVPDFHPNLGNGCILAHSMGLGKTIQTVTFVDFFLRNTPAKKVLCVVPVNTIQNWVCEFNRWVPPKPPPPPSPKIQTTAPQFPVNQGLYNIKYYAPFQHQLPENPMDFQNYLCVSELLEDMIEFIDSRTQAVQQTSYQHHQPPHQPLIHHYLDANATSNYYNPYATVEGLITQSSIYGVSACPFLENQEAVPLNGTSNSSSHIESSYHAPPLQQDVKGTKEPGVGDPLGESDYRTYEVYLIDTQKGWPDRIKTIDEWHENGGVLLIGYEMYRLVSNGLKTKKFRGKKGKLLLEGSRDIGKDMKQAVCDPGPDLVVCDEGHRIRNYQSGISQSLKSIVTKKRLVLTGYPIQNNLIEYWCMVDFVRPNYLGSRQEFANMFERPILNGQCVDSTQADKKIMRQRAHVLYSLLQGFVQRRDHSVFTSILPKKEEHVIMVRLSPLQKILYQRLIELTKEAYNDSLNPIKTFHLCCKIWNHPDILYKALQACQQGKEVDLFNDEDDISLDPDGKHKRKKQAVSVQPKTEQLPPPGSFNWPPVEPKEILMDITQWAPTIFKNYPFVPGDLQNSGKFDILNKLIQETIQADDKMLIFSQSLLTLNAIEEMLQRTPRTRDSNKCWQKGEHYLRLDGSTTSVEREKHIKLFNDKNNTNLRLFLLSTRAGCLGINLVAANRVVVFDVSWNPCHDAQAVCRIYRYGQTKPCHIYRLVASNTMEKKMYYRQISKQGISNRVVDEMNQTENFSKNEIQSLIIEDWVDEPPVDLVNFLSNQNDEVLANVLQSSKQWIAKVPFKHESLLINDTETEVLTGSEKRAAKRAYEVEKKMSQNRPYPLQPSFPRNTPVAPVKPFLWRPPSFPNSSSRITFPVMVSSQASVATSNNTINNAAISEYASMLASLTASVSNTSRDPTSSQQHPTVQSSSNENVGTHFNNLLNTVRHSLSVTNVVTTAPSATSTGTLTSLTAAVSTITTTHSFAQPSSLLDALRNTSKTSLPSSDATASVVRPISSSSFQSNATTIPTSSTITSYPPAISSISTPFPPTINTSTVPFPITPQIFQRDDMTSQYTYVPPPPLFQTNALYNPFHSISGSARDEFSDIHGHYLMLARQATEKKPGTPNSGSNVAGSSDGIIVLDSDDDE